DFCGKVTNQDVRHAFIMLSPHGYCKTSTGVLQDARIMRSKCQPTKCAVERRLRLYREWPIIGDRRPLFRRCEKVDASKGKALAILLRELFVVLDPQFDELLEVEEGDASGFLCSCLTVSVGGEASGAYVQSDVVASEPSHE